MGLSYNEETAVFKKSPLTYDNYRVDNENTIEDLEEPTELNFVSEGIVTNESAVVVQTDIEKYTFLSDFRSKILKISAWGTGNSNGAKRLTLKLNSSVIFDEYIIFNSTALSDFIGRVERNFVLNNVKIKKNDVIKLSFAGGATAGSVLNTSVYFFGSQ